LATLSDEERDPRGGLITLNDGPSTATGLVPVAASTNGGTG